jgi:DNA polymerase-3 subunit epsilon
MKLAVVDVETTGLFPSVDRVVEIAIVVLGLDGKPVTRFSSLVNPERDVGPTSIHGLTGEDVYSAPRLADLAGRILDVLEGTVAIAGHNVWFDNSFLRAEFQRFGYPWPEVPTLCTMHLAGGGRLAQCCEEFDVPPPESAHSALDDASAAAHLLFRILQDSPREAARVANLPPIQWPYFPTTQTMPLTRQQARSSGREAAGYLDRLLSRVGAPVEPEDAAAIKYLDVLFRAIEDRRIDESEGALLQSVAEDLGLSGTSIKRLHSILFQELVVEALRDGVLSDLEQRDLSRVSRLLSLQGNDAQDAIDRARRVAEGERQGISQSHSSENWAGKRVCFTGESQCIYESQPLTREKASALAIHHGLIVVESVTKKLDLLVLADPYSQSGKTAKARKYGIRVLHEPAFWAALGAEVG